ncbi:MAG TPA: hypothetical protein VMX94_11815 [Armatimonadota bacterium]|nr:hypothetical protein [Armatimonadota bacterium]
MKRWFPWITAAAIAVGLVWAFIYLGTRGPRLDEDHLAGVAIRLKNAKLVGRSGGKKVWAFEARTIDVSRDRRTATFKGVTRGCLLQDGKQIASLSAGKVIYNTFTQNVAVPGSAEVVLTDGPSFKVRDAYWDARKSRLFCRGGVDAALAGSTLHGERMTVDVGKKELTIYKVNGQIRLE